MFFLRPTGAIALVAAMVGCMPAQAPATDPMDAMASACIQAVEQETNNHDIVVIGSDPRSGIWDLTLLVGGTGDWSCEVTQSGGVMAVTYLGSDGSPLA